MTTKKILFALSCAAFILALGVVVLGAFTRLVHAGLGCPDWPTCYGHLWVPDEAHEIHAANQAFVDTPVETDKTWPEQIHRIFASTLGLFILAMFLLAVKKANNAVAFRSIYVLLALLVASVIVRIIVGDTVDGFLWLIVGAYFLNLLRLQKKLQQPTALLASLLAGLVILQGFFGMWTVTLKLWPQVVTAHLLGGFATLSLLWLFIQVSGDFRWQQDRQTLATLRLPALITLIAVILQIALGGWLSSNYAALACPDFPLCQNSVIPQANYAQGFNFFQHVGPNYLGGLLDNTARVAIHFSHRVGALVVTGLCLWLVVLLFQRGLRGWSAIVLSVLAVQVGLGISNVIFQLPLAVAVLHNAGGALLLLTLVSINHRVRCHSGD